MKKLVRLSALLAVSGIALFASSSNAAGKPGVVVMPINEYYCMCACPDGTIICLVDDSPDCGVCATAVCPNNEW